MRKIRYYLQLWVFFVFFATVNPPSWSNLSTSLSIGSTKDSNNPSGKILLAFNLVWEGMDIKKANLSAIEKFRREHPDVAFIQWLNPAYFYKKDMNAKETVGEIQKVIDAKDVLGVHLNPWKNLVEASGIPFRSSPTFWGNEMVPSVCKQDCGHEVALTAYTDEELQKILVFGKDTLRQNGFKVSPIFFAGGWLSSPKIWSVLKQSGFEYDFSPVPPHVINEELKYYPLGDWLRQTWKNITALTQPFRFQTENGLITVIPNNAATMEYQSISKVYSQYLALVQLLKKYPNKDFILSLGVYQETANEQLPRFAEVLKRIYADSEERQIDLAMFSLDHQVQDQEETDSMSASRVVKHQYLRPH